MLPLLFLVEKNMCVILLTYLMLRRSDHSSNERPSLALKDTPNFMKVLNCFLLAGLFFQTSGLLCQTEGLKPHHWDVQNRDSKSTIPLFLCIEKWLEGTQTQWLSLSCEALSGHSNIPAMHSACGSQGSCSQQWGLYSFWPRQGNRSMVKT